MANTTLDRIVALIDHLSPEEQTELTAYLLERSRRRQLSAREKIKLLRTAQIDVEVIEEPSVRREDWYGDDGR